MTRDRVRYRPQLVRAILQTLRWDCVAWIRDAEAVDTLQDSTQPTTSPDLAAGSLLTQWRPNMNASSNRIVIVEDDLSLQLALSRLLRATGFETQCFSSAEAMEASAAAASASCLIMDVKLPGTSGPACYVQLSPPRPPVVFITAYDSLAVRQAIKQAGAKWVLQKPFSGEALLFLVHALLTWTSP